MVTVAALLSAVAACDTAPIPAPTPASPPVSGTPAALAVSPLRLPEVGPGGACPTSAPQPWSRADQASRVLGPGPVYPVADYFGDGTVLRLRAHDRQADGSYRTKVRWIASGYTGPVLVRAARIDGPGTAAAEFSYLGDPRDGGHHAVLTHPDSDLPGTTVVGGPGCYAYQVDGTTFSVTVVFRAEPESP
ncbi:hypothetical protein AWW66_10660 [Micromonospora rosaria]|uniref:Uncharacterized protein n=1 Tax=Micromonospora rosaria TaxID=47874 RepID=A0A136PUG5_9ACTN|nr:hypothetical protein AWW66_10660 [Micromonospora rosaria]